MQETQRNSQMLLSKKTMKNALAIGTMEPTRILNMLRTALNRPTTRSTRQLRNSSIKLKGKARGARLISEIPTTKKSNIHHGFCKNGRSQRANILIPSSAVKMKTNMTSSCSNSDRRFCASLEPANPEIWAE